MGTENETEKKADKEEVEKTVVVLVDGDEFEIPKKDVTVRIILTAAGLDVNARYLIEKQGSHTISYKDKLDEEINGIHKGKEFFTGRLGPVTVSGR